MSESAGAVRPRERIIDIRQLEALLAVAEEGSFTAAADRLHTVQSNVSEHIRQLEADLGVQLLVRDRRGAIPTEFGVKVLERARAIRSELDALRRDLSMLQGLQVGHATLGVVGTVSPWLVPPLVAEIARVAPGVSLRLTEGASERLALEVAERELAFAVVTEPVADTRLVVEHLRDEALVGLLPAGLELGVAEPVPLSALAEHGLILPPVGNPLRDEVDVAAAAAHLQLRVPVEVEGIRLIGDLVAAGAGLSIVPEGAVAAREGVQHVAIFDMPPRRLALVRARGAQLTLADQAVHDVVAHLVREHV
jgi:LysR family transcriptional regulator, nitrogen assimilation regulatory protein